MSVSYGLSVKQESTMNLLTVVLANAKGTLYMLRYATLRRECD